MSSFKTAFSLTSFTLIKILSNSSLLSAIRVVSSAFMRWLIFLRAVLITAYDSSSLTFHMMYSEYKLNKQCAFIYICTYVTNDNNTNSAKEKRENGAQLELSLGVLLKLS